LLVAEFHPVEVIDVMAPLTIFVEINAGEVIVPEAGGIEFSSVDHHSKMESG
jgi:hypothetical protein